MAVLFWSNGLNANSASSNVDKSVLEVSDVSDTGGQVHFKVTNHSPNPVLAYLISITWHLPNGHAMSHTFVKDHILTLPLVGKVIAAPPHTQIGPLTQGESETWNFHGPSDRDSMPTIEPVAVVYMDNSIVGDQEQAIARIFSRHQALRDATERHLESLRKIAALPSGDILSALRGLKGQYDDRPSDNVSIQQSSPANRANEGQQPSDDGQVYGRLNYDLDQVIKHISSGNTTPETALSRYIARVEDQLKAFTDHSNPA